MASSALKKAETHDKATAISFSICPPRGPIPLVGFSLSAFSDRAVLQAPHELASHDLLLRLDGKHGLERGDWHNHAATDAHYWDLAPTRRLVSRVFANA